MPSNVTPSIWLSPSRGSAQNPVGPTQGLSRLGLWVADLRNDALSSSLLPAYFGRLSLYDSSKRPWQLTSNLLPTEHLVSSKMLLQK